MNEMKIFEREGLGTVRVVMRDDEPWFVAKDVCSCLEIQNVSDTVNKVLDDDEKGIDTIYTLGGEQEMVVVSEAGLYSLILRSRKPEARQFKRWVTHEVLPAIRKTGAYSLAPKTYPEALRALAAEVEMREAVEQQKALAEAQRDEAIRTKAEIGNRREATSMATASAAVRKANALEDELGRGRRYKTVKAIPWLLSVFTDSKGMYSAVGKALKRISNDLGYKIENVPTPEFPNGVNAYHVDVVSAFRQELYDNVGMLERYRHHAESCA